MKSVRNLMSNRETEINAFFDLLDFMHQHNKRGLPTIFSNETSENPATFNLESQHLHMLTATAYLLLYNYVEAVVTQCLEALSKKIKTEQKSILEFTETIQKEWVVQKILPNDQSINVERIITRIINEFKTIHSQIDDLKISKGGGGNFDNEAIHKLCDRLCINFKTSRKISENLHRYKDYAFSEKKMSFMKEVRDFRNKLAHGELSFMELGRNCQIDRLNHTKQVIFDYMESFIDSVESHINEKGFLQS
ncbi:hypothetical protein V757_00965 [Pelistega indica]|uniref:MAE-28990/MAE-18760-like HEPN domain-containing protein n=1 Tax=Pelistega indica TaxID=1414851 RepID=V8GB72_9BURK|nr:MAE_28990/MAE_18760 family HEPN-like nuclease [Pelistega indica]ETD72982.1 hypothetical protein V757_00965 [Pelistega indica]